MKDYYQILEVSPGASLEEIRLAYRRLAKLYHPDKVGQGNQAAAVAMEDINEAYATLRDAQKRSTYDLRRVAPDTYEILVAASPRHRPFRPAFRVFTERDQVLPYLSHTRWICRVSLLFCFLLLLDYLLPRTLIEDEVAFITIEYDTSLSGRSLQIENALLHTHDGLEIGINSNGEKFFSKNRDLLVHRTPIFNEAVEVSSQVDAQHSFLVWRSLFGSFLFLPLLLVLVAALGVLKRFKPELTFSFGVAAGFLLFLCVTLLIG